MIKQSNSLGRRLAACSSQSVCGKTWSLLPTVPPKALWIYHRTTLKRRRAHGVAWPAATCYKITRGPGLARESRRHGPRRARAGDTAGAWRLGIVKKVLSKTEGVSWRTRESRRRRRRQGSAGLGRRLLRRRDVQKLVQLADAAIQHRVEPTAISFRRSGGGGVASEDAFLARRVGRTLITEKDSI